jgi:hypothetical protein
MVKPVGPSPGNDCVMPDAASRYHQTHTRVRKRKAGHHVHRASSPSHRHVHKTPSRGNALPASVRRVVFVPCNTGTRQVAEPLKGAGPGAHAPGPSKVGTVKGAPVQAPEAPKDGAPVRVETLAPVEGGQLPPQLPPDVGLRQALAPFFARLRAGNMSNADYILWDRARIDAISKLKLTGVVTSGSPSDYVRFPDGSGLEIFPTAYTKEWPHFLGVRYYRPPGRR